MPKYMECGINEETNYILVAFAENGRIMGSLTGVPASNIADKLWLVFQAIGDIAFAYPYTVILLEIQVPFIFQLGGRGTCKGEFNLNALTSKL